MSQSRSKSEAGFEIDGGSAWLAGTVDPSAGVGIAAPISSHYDRNNGGVSERYEKTGAADTAWTIITSGGALAEDVFQNTFIGKTGVGDEKPSYTGGGASTIANDDSLETAINKADIYLGSAIVDNSRIFSPVTNQIVKANIEALSDAVGLDAELINTNYITVNSSLYTKVSLLDGQVKTNTTAITALEVGMTWYGGDAPKVITDDVDLRAASNGTALSTLLPFSDDDGTQLVIGDFIAGDLLCSRDNGTDNQKIFSVYDDTGTLKVTVSGVDQLVSGNVFFVKYNLPAGASYEGRAAYRYDGTDIVLHIDLDFETANTIQTTSGYTASSGDPTAEETVETILEKIDGNVDAVNSSMGIAQGAVNMGTYTGTLIPDNETTKQNIQTLETKTEIIDGNVDNVNSQIGRAQSDTDMGTYTGDIIPDNESAKQNIQSLETETEIIDGNVDNINSQIGRAQSDTDMGTYTGSLIPDNETAKQNIQTLETEVEKSRIEIDDTLVATVQKTVDTIALTGSHGYQWDIIIYETATPANTNGSIVTCVANVGGNSNASRYGINEIGTPMTLVFDISVSGSDLLLKLTSNVNSIVKVIRKKIL